MHIDHRKVKCLEFCFLFVCFVMQKNMIRCSCILTCLVEHTLAAVGTLCMPIVGKGNLYSYVAQGTPSEGSELTFLKQRKIHSGGGDKKN